MLRRPLVPLLTLLLIALPAAAQDNVFPDLSGRVVDEAEILSPATETQLIDLLAGHESATTNQVVVVTLSSLRGYDIADYGLRLGRAWGIGQEGANNGVILIVAPNERAVRIEVGYGLEASLTDATTKLIIEREIIPAFKAGDLEGGVVRGTQAILAALGGGYLPPPEDQGNANETLGAVVVALIALGYGGLFLFGLAHARGRGRGGSRTTTSGSTTRRSFSSGGSSSSGSSGFSGGGGSFGGGGASGHW